MSIETVRHALLWCTLINYGLLMAWFLIFLLAHDPLKRLHSRCFQLTAEQFDLANYALMGLYKLGILLFNIIPCIALYIVG